MIKIKNNYGATSEATCEKHRHLIESTILGTLSFHQTEEPCAECERERFEAERPARVLAALKHPAFAYVRHNRWGTISIYHRNAESPTGVLSAGGCSREEYAEILRTNSFERNMTPCSVVEFGERH